MAPDVAANGAGIPAGGGFRGSERNVEARYPAPLGQQFRPARTTDVENASALRHEVQDGFVIAIDQEVQQDSPAGARQPGGVKVDFGVVSSLIETIFTCRTVQDAALPVETLSAPAPAIPGAQPHRPAAGRTAHCRDFNTASRLRV